MIYNKRKKEIYKERKKSESLVFYDIYVGGRFNPFRTFLYSFPPSRIISSTSFLKILSLTSLYSFGTGIHLPARHINLPCSSIFPIPTPPTFVCMVTYSSFILHHQLPFLNLTYKKQYAHEVLTSSSYFQS